jgi:hypothetical protein
MSTEIGLARKHKVFVVKETTTGTLKFPADGDLILPAGNAKINQNPEFKDSDELRDTLDIIDQFPNARPAGSWSIPMYFRPSATAGLQPQGGPLFESLQGKVGASTFTIAASVLVGATSIPFTTLAGDRLPGKGVVTIQTEDIYYSSVVMSTETAGTFTVGISGRGYNGTTAAAHDGSVTPITGCALKSVFYKQDTTSPSFSMWTKTDHLVQGLSGCTASELKIDLNNEGAVMFSFSGQGMEMVWAGTSTAAGATTSTTLIVVDAGLYSVGARIYNATTGVDNSGDGYVITAINYGTDALTLDDAIVASLNDVIAGFLPDGTAKADPIESKDTTIYIDGSPAKIRTSTLTISAPKNYLTDEVGTQYPEEYVEDVRKVTADFNLYCKPATVKYIRDGYEANEFIFNATLGDTVGSILEIYNARCRTTAPEIGEDGPTMTLSMTMTALGTNGEDSCDLIVR